MNKSTPQSFFEPNLSPENVKTALSTQENILKLLKKMRLYRKPLKNSCVVTNNDAEGKLTILSSILENNIKSLKDGLNKGN